MRKFTATEWIDLARGQRVLAIKAEESLERNKATTAASQFVTAREYHLKLAALCEEWAKLASD
jgi:hypothetical protein